MPICTPCATGILEQGTRLERVRACAVGFAIRCLRPLGQPCVVNFPKETSVSPLGEVSQVALAHRLILLVRSRHTFIPAAAHSLFSGSSSIHEYSPEVLRVQHGLVPFITRPVFAEQRKTVGMPKEKTRKLFGYRVFAWLGEETATYCPILLKQPRLHEGENLRV